MWCLMEFSSPFDYRLEKAIKLEIQEGGEDSFE